VWRFLGRPRRLEAQALIRHELGHLVNGDVGRTYRAGVALGLFLAVFAIPVAILAATRPQSVATSSARDSLPWQ
jgi:Zn-dependent protease with chaperone function